MQGKSFFDGVEEAFNTMTADAAIKCREIVQMYAELYPKPFTLELVRPRLEKHWSLLKAIGEVSPIGLCLINWDTRLIEWRNGAYERVFLNVLDVKSHEGVPVGSLVPQFAEQGIDKLFDNVARTGEPFQAPCFPISMPSGLTHWNCSLSKLPSTDGATYILVQLQQVQAPAQTLAA